jgi:Putative motility protein
MDVPNIASLSTTMATTNTQAAISVAVQKKAMDIQANTAAAMLAALPPATTPNLPPHLGKNVNTTA